MDNSTDGIVITDIRGCVVKASNSVLKMLKLDEGHVIGIYGLEFISPKDRKKAYADTTLRLRGKHIGEAVCYNAVKANGETFFLEVNTAPILNASGSPSGMVIVFRDVTKRKQQEETLAEANRKLTILSITDALTGVANRRYFDEMLKSEYSRHVRLRKELALIIMDIDHFKNYNDFYGHLQGDACLKQVAQTLSESVYRPYDLVARYGGEEFVLILPDTGIQGATLVAERIRQSIANLGIPHETSPTAPMVTASFGVVASRCVMSKDVSYMVSEVDRMLYRAKSEGRNRVVGNQNEFNDPNSIDKFTALQWRSDYMSGEPIIDNEHIGLFNSVNSLLEIQLPQKELYAYIDGMLDSVALHFHDEEHLLHTVNYPATEEHAKEHEKLLKIANSLVQQYKEKRIPISNLFLFLAYELVEQHMLRMDKLFFPYFSQR